MGNGQLGNANSAQPLPGGSVADASITAFEIADGAVTNVKLASDAVRSQQAFNVQTVSSYTLLLSDANFNSILAINSSSAATIVIPTNASVAFPTGSVVNIVQLGAGQITVSTSVGVTLNSESSRFKSRGQYAVISLLKVDTNSWVMFGSTI